MRMLTKGELDGLGLIDITKGSRGPVGIDIVHLVRVELGVLERINHATAGSIAIGHGDMMRIRAHAVANQLAIDFGAALFGMLVLLEYQHPGPLTLLKTIPVDIPRAIRSLWSIRAGRKRPLGCQRHDPQGRCRRLGTPRDHDVRLALSKQAPRISHGMQSGGAGGHDSVARSPEY